MHITMEKLDLLKNMERPKAYVRREQSKSQSDDAFVEKCL